MPIPPLKANITVAAAATVAASCDPHKLWNLDSCWLFLQDPCAQDSFRGEVLVEDGGGATIRRACGIEGDANAAANELSKAMVSTT